MGAVMSYAMALSVERPAVAGILAFSGFVPTVEGWAPHFEDRLGTRAFIAHGSRDPVIGIEFAERARQLLEEGGLAVEHYESELGHQIEPAHLTAARSWLEETILPR
jgi:phospholipase/carboxylesterase